MTGCATTLGSDDRAARPRARQQHPCAARARTPRRAVRCRRAFRRPGRTSAPGNPARTSAMGPCLTSAELKASACRPQVSLSLSAASCATAEAEAARHDEQVERRRAAPRRPRSSRIPRRAPAAPAAAPAPRTGPAPGSSSRPAARCSSARRCTTWSRRRWFPRPACSGTATSTRCMSGASGVLHSATVSAPLRLCALGGRQQVGTLAGLRDRDEQHVAHVGAGVVDRAQRRRGGGGQRRRVRLDQVARVGGRVIGAAARAGHDGARRRWRAAVRRVRRAARHCCASCAATTLGALGRLEEHPRGLHSR